MTGQVPRLIDYRYRRPGKPETAFREQLVIDRRDVKVLLLERYEGKALEVGGVRVLDAGAPIVWFVFPGAWHDVGRFHLADGTFTGWYTNLTEPVSFRDEAHWTCTDMFLDLWTPQDGTSSWLDEDEFAEAIRAGLIDKATEQRVLAERAAIDILAETAAWPPAICRDVDLEAALTRRDGP